MRPVLKISFNLLINNHFEQAEWQVFDVVGKLVKDGRSAEPLTSINLSNETNGIYFIIVRLDKTVFKRKVIKF